MKKHGDRYRRFGQYTLIGLAALFAIERWTLRDSRSILAFVYYAGQPIVIAGLLFLAAAIAWRRGGRRRVANCTAIAAIAFSVVWAAQSFRFHNETASDVGGRVVVWNVMSGRMGWAGVYQTIAELDADVVVMIEAWEDSERRAAHLRQFLPGYTATSEHGGLVILSRLGLEDVEYGRLGRGSKFLHAGVRVGGERVGIIGVDVESDPRRFRKYPLEDLADVASRYDGHPLVIVGDFNTPPDSVHFARMRSRLRNAFEVCGNGYAPTWPSFAPVLALDQIWVNERVNACRCVSNWTMQSDHRPAVFDFGL